MKTKRSNRTKKSNVIQINKKAEPQEERQKFRIQETLNEELADAYVAAARADNALENLVGNSFVDRIVTMEQAESLEDALYFCIHLARDLQDFIEGHRLSSTTKTLTDFLEQNGYPQNPQEAVAR